MPPRSGRDPLLVRLLRRQHPLVRAGAGLLLGPMLFRQAVRAQQGRFAGPALILSFDCDFPADVEQLPRVAEVLAGRGIRASFAVVGQWVEKWPDRHRALVAAGHELLNHTHTHPNLRNDAYPFAADPGFTARTFKSLSVAERREELSRCHGAVRRHLGVEMTGCRLPHFGNLRADEIYPLLAELGYRFSSSTLAMLAPGCGVPFRTPEGIWEVPVTGCPRHPYATFDTWHCLVRRGGWHRRPGELAALFRAALDLAEQHGGLINIYLDPKDVADNPDFPRMLDDALGRKSLSLTRYGELPGIAGKA